MKRTWIEDGIELLENGRGDRLGWGYRSDGEPYVEATALVALALLSSSPPTAARRARDQALSAGDWIASLQQPSGAVGLSARFPQPRWPTSFALLLWSALQSHERERDRAVQWLLSEAGYTFEHGPSDPIEHDTTIPGWPWVTGTHSWLEPTAFAVLALRRVGKGDSPRVADGLRLIRDRAIRGGGWNYGNNVVFGTDLRAQPAPTGAALLALRATQGAEAVAGAALEYLARSLPGIRSAQSLGFGLMGMSAWQRRPKEADGWLAEAFERAHRRPDGMIQVAYLLLAATPGTPTIWYGNDGKD